MHKRKYRRWQRDAPTQLWQLDIVMGVPLADGRKAKMVTGIADHRLASLRVCRCWLPVWLPESRMHWGLQMSESNSDRGVCGGQPCGGRQRQHRECATWREPLSCPRTGRPLPQRVTAPGCHGLSEARGSMLLCLSRGRVTFPGLIYRGRGARTPGRGRPPDPPDQADRGLGRVP